VTTYRSTLKADRKMLAKYNEVMLKNGILKGSQKHCVSTVHTNEDVECTIRAFQAPRSATCPQRMRARCGPLGR
jgi:glutamate-1-semialdehyde aminotransferase